MSPGAAIAVGFWLGVPGALFLYGLSHDVRRRLDDRRERQRRLQEGVERAKRSIIRGQELFQERRALEIERRALALEHLREYEARAEAERESAAAEYTLWVRSLPEVAER